MESIKEQLRIHSLSENPDFRSIADLLLNKTLLNTKTKAFRICEIEFYLHDPAHKDEYTHCSKDQLRFGTFYFHKFKNGGFKEGTYKCVDLTLGSSERQRYWGVLIRSIYDLNKKEFIEGPCRSVTRIFEEYGITSVKEFMKTEDILEAFD